VPRFYPLLLVLALAAPAQANTVGCGDNAYSFAEVVSRPRGARERGPLVSVPDSLCADLIETRPRQIESLSIHIGDQPRFDRAAPEASPAASKAPPVAPPAPGKKPGR
jgi:hypothetical protein